VKILFLESSPIWLNGLPHGFHDLGHEVMASGPLTKENTPRIIEQFSPDFIFTVGWGPEQSITKQNWIRECTKKAKLIYWAVEDPHFTSVYTLPLIKRMRPDFVFTLAKDLVHFYKNRGIPSEHLDFGFHPAIHRKVEPIADFKSDISIVANGYPLVLQESPNHFRNESLRILLNPLLKNNVKVNIWGRHWGEMKPILGYSIPTHSIKGHISYLDANKVYSSSNIILGPQNYKTQVTQRTYEILASGGFLITLDTPAIRELFKPGEEIIVSSSSEETLKLTKYFLENPVEREKIRMQGQFAVQPHSYKQRASYIIDCLKKEKII